MADGDKKPFHERVAEKIIDQLRAGTAPWQKPWSPPQDGTPHQSILPMNPTTGKRYRGVNVVNLMAEGHADNRWMTYKQAAAIGAQVRKGEKGTAVQYWKFDDERPALDANNRPITDAEGKPVTVRVPLERPRAFYATVFNAEQIDGLPALAPPAPPSWNPVERAERLLVASGAEIFERPGDRAFYSPVLDSIVVPERSQFPSADRFYATALHEVGHWSGHPSRLDRDLAHPFGTEAYAREELRAEIASLLLGEELQIGHDPGQHTAYVASWIKVLEDDPMEIVRACADAEKIQSFLLAFEQTLEQQQAPHIADAADLAPVNVALAAPLTAATLSGGVSFDHFHSYNHGYDPTDGAPYPNLDAALEAAGFKTLGDVVGDRSWDFAAMRETAIVRLSPVFGIAPESQGDGAEWNAYLERKGLADEFAMTGEALTWHRQATATEQTAIPTEDLFIDGPNGRWDIMESVPGTSGDRDVFVARTNSAVEAIARFHEGRGRYVVDTTSDEIMASTMSMAGSDAELGKPSAALLAFAAIEERGVASAYEAATLTAEQAMQLAARTHAGDAPTPADEPIEFTAYNVMIDRTGYSAHGAGPIGDALKDHGLHNVGDVVGEISLDYAAMRDVALDRLAPVYRIGPDGNGSPEALAERRELAEAFADTGERIALGWPRAVPQAWSGEPPFARRRLAEMSPEDQEAAFGNAEQAGEKAEPMPTNAQLEPGLWKAYGRGLDQREWAFKVHEQHEDGEISAAEWAALARRRREAERLDPSRSATIAPQESARVDINVPYRERVEAKQLGAKWDKEARTWYVPAGHDPTRFAKWAKSATETPAQQLAATAPAQVQAGGDHRSQAGTEAPEGSDPIVSPQTESDAPEWDGAYTDELTEEISDQQASTGEPKEEQAMAQAPRKYLAVPYGERQLAKAAGAKWDAGQKSWYAPPGANMEAFARWGLDRRATVAGKDLTPAQKEQAVRADLADAMKQAGLTVPKDHPIIDGKRHRVPTVDDKQGETSGFYIAYNDGVPAGNIKDYRSGVSVNWKFTGGLLTEEEKAQLNASAAQKLADREAAQLATYEKAAQRVQGQSADYRPLTETVPYLERKGLTPSIGAMTDGKDSTIHLPAIDVTGKHWTTQYIQEDGTKRFAKDSRKEGCFHIVGGDLGALEKAPAILIAEGYATARRVNGVVDHPTIAAFDSGNLEPVALALRERFPDKPLVIFGDDDVRVMQKHGTNPGREKADKAAKAADGIAVLPIFAPGEQEADPRSFTDFDDLARSQLGTEGVERQVKAAIERGYQHAQSRDAKDHQLDPRQIEAPRHTIDEQPAQRQGNSGIEEPKRVARHRM